MALNQITSKSALKTYVEDLLVPSDSQMYVHYHFYSNSSRIIIILINPLSIPFKTLVCGLLAQFCLDI